MIFFTGGKRMISHTWGKTGNEVAGKQFHVGKYKGGNVQDFVLTRFLVNEF